MCMTLCMTLCMILCMTLYIVLYVTFVKSKGRQETDVYKFQHSKMLKSLLINHFMIWISRRSTFSL